MLESLAQEPVWTTVGIVGQAVFGGRFILQWIVSEYKKKSHVPDIFWYMSLVGSILLLFYTIHRNEPILAIGFSANILIYIRNIHLIFKHSKSGRITPVENEED